MTQTTGIIQERRALACEPVSGGVYNVTTLERQIRFSGKTIRINSSLPEGRYGTDILLLTQVVKGFQTRCL